MGVQPANPFGLSVGDPIARNVRYDSDELVDVSGGDGHSGPRHGELVRESLGRDHDQRVRAHRPPDVNFPLLLFLDGRFFGADFFALDADANAFADFRAILDLEDGFPIGALLSGPGVDGEPTPFFGVFNIAVPPGLVPAPPALALFGLGAAALLAGWYGKGRPIAAGAVDRWQTVTKARPHAGASSTAA